MTVDQIEKAKALYRCTFLPGSYDKRFVHAMYYMSIQKPETELTEKQAALLDKMIYRYRRQLARITP